MKKLILALVLAVGALFFGSSSPAEAAVFQYETGGKSCYELWKTLGQPLPMLCARESAGLTGDKLVLTFSSDLTNLYLNHTPAGLCSPKIFNSADNWDNCISSLWVAVGPGDSICMYRYDNYDSRIIWYYNSSTTTTIFRQMKDLASFNDTISSIKLAQSGGFACGG